MSVFILLGYLLAVVFFLLAAFGVSSPRLNFVALGLFSWVAVELAQKL